MGDIEGVDPADLRDALAEVEGKKPTLRLCVAIGYENGVSPTELAEWYGLSRATVYNWLDRVERLATEPAAEVLVDADRPGRPPKLSAAERERLTATLTSPPTEVGFDEADWTPALVGRYVESTFGAVYTRRHVRDLLHGLGFSPDSDGAWRPDG